jgi:acyl carrier protein
LQTAISPKEGAEAFGRILASSLSRLVVATTDLQTIIDTRMAERTASVVEEAMEEPAAPAHHPRPGLNTAYIPPATATQREMVDIWQSLLGISPVGIHDNFFELGGHSLLALQLISQLRAKMHLELSIQKLFDAPTIAQIAALAETSEGIGLRDAEMVAELLERVERLSDEEARELLAKRSTDGLWSEQGA